MKVIKVKKVKFWKMLQIVWNVCKIKIFFEIHLKTMFLVLLISSTFSMLDLVNFPHDFMIKKFYQVFQRDIREL